MASASFSSLPLDILRYLADRIHPPDLWSFVLTCKATSLSEVSGHSLRLHRERLSECDRIDNEEELTLTELLCKCVKDPWAGYYIEELEILHGRDSWDLDWVESNSHHQQEVVKKYLRIKENRVGIAAAIAAAKIKLPTQHSAEQLKLLRRLYSKLSSSPKRINCPGWKRSSWAARSQL